MFFEILGGALAVVIIIFAAVKLHHKKTTEDVKAKVRHQLGSYGELFHEGNKWFLKTKNHTYLVLFFYVPLNSELTVNSRTIWEIKDATKTRLIDQSVFLSSKLTKLIIIFPTTVTIKRYINENELEFVKYNKSFYDMYLIRHFELDKILEENIL
ncbi:hypothetical protein [Peloplasma aerotolerans]|jgi:hypothetical protein|uniref:Uncharacterized protein n=1 Tax=Peloplasma aerotolerans TaxID=3044389 RepID=A0AAW6U8C4_9MOLU|nr:hypothetical protein [Mariniplasma sp. M4Ah]MDI6453175.1 hypothetical protein [Mariniplasma sp. M4Ah]